MMDTGGEGEIARKRRGSCRKWQQERGRTGRAGGKDRGSSDQRNNGYCSALLG